MGLSSSLQIIHLTKLFAEELGAVCTKAQVYTFYCFLPEFALLFVRVIRCHQQSVERIIYSSGVSSVIEERAFCSGSLTVTTSCCHQTSQQKQERRAKKWLARTSARYDEQDNNGNSRRRRPIGRSSIHPSLRYKVLICCYRVEQAETL